MALDALRCNHLAPLGFKGLTARLLSRIALRYIVRRNRRSERDRPNREDVENGSI